MKIEKLLYGGLGILFFLLLVAVIPRTGFMGDINLFAAWCERIFLDGLGNIYAWKVNYHPIYLYWLKIFGVFQGSADQIFQYKFYLKVFPLVFDFLGAYVIFFLVKPSLRTYYLPFLLLFNIAYLYNSLIWGQVDSVHTFFIAAAIIAGLRKNIFWCLIGLVLAFNTKLQSIIFWPVLFFLLIPLLQLPAKNWIKALAAAALLQAIILIPFWQAGHLGSFGRVITGASGVHPVVSLHAFNLWYLLLDVDPTVLFDDQRWLRDLSFRNWGFLFFFLFGFLSLLPLLIRSYRNWKAKLPFTEKDFPLVFFTAGLMALIFFYFPTQMHERYAHPAILLFFLGGYFSKNYWPYLFISILYLLNLEAILHYFQLNNYSTFIFAPKAISVGYLLLMGYVFLLCYRKHI